MPKWNALAYFRKSFTRSRSETDFLVIKKIRDFAPNLFTLSCCGGKTWNNSIGKLSFPIFYVSLSLSLAFSHALSLSFSHAPIHTAKPSRVKGKSVWRLLFCSSPHHSLSIETSAATQIISSSTKHLNSIPGKIKLERLFLASLSRLLLSSLKDLRYHHSSLYILEKLGEFC